MRPLFWCALCLLALTTLSACANSYDDFAYPGKLTIRGRNSSL